uniref:G-protein coupled receptors family 1 profile domain-containing protein n=1 Tax=Anopheles epiroticus TaxID=199890 RepID=A0A182P9A6_9DIPT
MSTKLELNARLDNSWNRKAKHAEHCYCCFSEHARNLSGNVFVIAAILLERNLQSVANHLILSLAVADLLVACLVMPLGAVYEVSKEWRLGADLCDMWTSSDVLCCTASILHLVAIALDR